MNLQRVLRELADAGTAVLLVEHDVDLVFDVADRVYAMAEGRLLASGTAGRGPCAPRGAGGLPRRRGRPA